LYVYAVPFIRTELLIIFSGTEIRR